jgi:hypothetical protein
MCKTDICMTIQYIRMQLGISAFCTYANREKTDRHESRQTDVNQDRQTWIKTDRHQSWIYHYIITTFISARILADIRVNVYANVRTHALRLQHESFTGSAVRQQGTHVTAWKRSHARQPEIHVTLSLCSRIHIQCVNATHHTFTLSRQEIGHLTRFRPSSANRARGKA